MEAKAPADAETPPLVRTIDLRVWYPLSRRLFRDTEWIRALDGVTLDVRAGETLGIVGESGSGKSTFGRAVVRLTRITSGRVEFNGQDITTMPLGRLRPLRRDFQMVFQDPYSSLDPRQRVRDILSEPFQIHGQAHGRVDASIRNLLDVVGLPHMVLERKSAQLSGGQNQRVAIARALALRPRLIVCDEPVSALDVSIQAQVVNLLGELQDQFGLTYIFIAHDLAVVRHLADRVAVMYLGKVVELGRADEIYSSPVNPYTVALLSAAPIPDTRVERTRPRIILTGDIPSAAKPPQGCRFQNRCWLRKELGNPDVCVQIEPGLVPVGLADSEHVAACHFPVEAATRGGAFLKSEPAPFV